MMRDENPTSVHFSQQERGYSQTVEVYRCQVPLEELEGTERDDVKFCGHCAKNVYRVQDINGFVDMVAAGQCVWVEPQDYLNSGCAPLLGSPSPPCDPMPSDPFGLLGLERLFDPILLNPIGLYDFEHLLALKLQEADFYLIGDLIQTTEELLSKKLHLGHEEIKRIKEVLASHGLVLGTKLEGWQWGLNLPNDVK